MRIPHACLQQKETDAYIFTTESLGGKNYAIEYSKKVINFYNFENCEIRFIFAYCPNDPH